MELPSSLTSLEIPAPSGAPYRAVQGRDKNAVRYFRAESEAAMIDAFAAVGVDVPPGEENFHAAGIGNVSLIGKIYKDAIYAEDRETLITPPVAKAGYHFNIF